MPHLVRGGASTLRELASAAGVSVSTVRHYFGDAEGAVEAALRAMNALGAPHMERAARAARGSLEASVRWFVDELVAGFRDHGVGPMHHTALAAGLASDRLGPVYVRELLEPMLSSAEARLTTHAARGELCERADLRHAALALVSPVVLALLHQDALGGRGCRPLDLDAFAEEHVARWLDAWAS